MVKSQAKPMPNHRSLSELVEFFDSHDMGDYWDDMPEVHFDVNLQNRKHLVEIEEEIIPTLTEIAKSRKMSYELLINSWLREKISETQPQFS